jgi:hypothetical protein
MTIRKCDATREVTIGLSMAKLYGKGDIAFFSPNMRTTYNLRTHDTTPDAQINPAYQISDRIPKQEFLTL